MKYSTPFSSIASIWYITYWFSYSWLSCLEHSAYNLVHFFSCSPFGLKYVSSSCNGFLLACFSILSIKFYWESLYLLSIFIRSWLVTGPHIKSIIISLLFRAFMCASTKLIIHWLHVCISIFSTTGSKTDSQ